MLPGTEAPGGIFYTTPLPGPTTNGVIVLGEEWILNLATCSRMKWEGIAMKMTKIRTAVVALLLLPVPSAHAQTTATPQTTASRDVEADEPAPVVVNGDTILWITAGAGVYTPTFRAARMNARRRSICRSNRRCPPAVRVAVMRPWLS